MGDDDQVEVSEADVRGLAVLQAALGAGPVMFWVVIAAMSQVPDLQGKVATPEQVQLVTLLSAVHGFVCLSCWPMAMFMFQRTLTGPAPVREGDAPLARLRAATILRLALLEGAALFGAVVCFMALQFGAARKLPLVWLNAISTFVLLFVVIVTFPTKERVTRTLRALRV